MRVVLLLVFCIGFSLLITSCENSTGVDDRLLYFDTSKMSYSKMVKVGDTLKVPVSIKNINKLYFFTNEWIGKISGFPDRLFIKDAEFDTTLFFTPQIEDIGLQEIHLSIDPDWDDTIVETDSFIVEFEVLPPRIALGSYDNTVTVGESFKVPFVLNYTGLSVTCDRGVIIGDSLLLFPTTEADLGFQQIFIDIKDGSEVNTDTLNFFVVEPNTLKVGDTWSFYTIDWYTSYYPLSWVNLITTVSDTLVVNNINSHLDTIHIEVTKKSELRRFSDSIDPALNSYDA